MYLAHAVSISQLAAQNQHSDKNLIILYSITLFVNAALLFIIEPMVAKMILPFLGGSPAVWNASLVFYQGCLLVGYAYAHYGSSWLGSKRHAFVHLGLVFAAILLLPVALPIDWFATPIESPTTLVLGALTVSIGFPFLVIAAGAPLLKSGSRSVATAPRAIPISYTRRATLAA